ncbi:NAD(P)H-quinone oxidoreductase [Salinisphaera orenii]|uniref:NAD(P)H-quinone oxidoreductase n=1 Tax=Salinisphaera orenii TaxID=856731 RepID=UPI000DBE888F
MKAWFIDAESADNPLYIDEIEEPTLDRQSVRVAVRAFSINRADLLQRQGRYPPPPGFDPLRPGIEYAGEVVEIGQDVTERAIGDRVMGLIGGGAYADQVVVHARETIAVPEGFEWAQAAAVPEAFATAYRALFLEGGVCPGQWALIRGATSGVGQAGLQLLYALGVRVIATSRTSERLKDLDARFVDAGFERAATWALTDGDEGVAEAVQSEIGGADVVMDFVGGAALNDNLDALVAEGTQVQVGVIGGGATDFDVGKMLARRLTLRGMTMRSLPIERKIAVARWFESRLVPLFEAGRLVPMIDQVFDFNALNEAQAEMAAGQHLGRIVVTV